MPLATRACRSEGTSLMKPCAWLTPPSARVCTMTGSKAPVLLPCAFESVASAGLPRACRVRSSCDLSDAGSASAPCMPLCTVWAAFSTSEMATFCFETSSPFVICC